MSVKKVVVNVVVKGEERVAALNTLVERDHSSRAGVLNKALDLLIEKESALELACAG